MYTLNKSDYAFTVILNKGLSLAVRLTDSFTGKTLLNNAYVKIEGFNALIKPDGYFVFTQLPKSDRYVKIGGAKYYEEIIHIESSHETFLNFYLHPTPAFVFPKNTAYIAVKNRKLLPNKKYYAVPKDNTGYEYSPRNRAMALINKKIKIYPFAEEMPEITNDYTSRVLPLSQGRTNESGLLFIPLWGVEEECKEVVIYTEEGRELFSAPISKSLKEGDLLGPCGM
ncbi:MAG: hypothetical protein FWE27_00165 [Defluviitaleaceae bacterium]|nr:hypothetical protein [Defluviitaleaceae bacterium]